MELPARLSVTKYKRIKSRAQHYQKRASVLYMDTLRSWRQVP